MNTTYRNALVEDFNRQKFNPSQKDSILERFDKLAAIRGEEFSFRIFYESYGSRDDTQAKVQTIKGLIEKELSDFNKSHRGIDTNPISRLRRIIERHNELVDCASVSIDGVDITPEELAAGKIKVPSFAKDCVAYTATASSKAKGLTLVVTY